MTNFKWLPALLGLFLFACQPGMNLDSQAVAEPTPDFQEELALLSDIPAFTSNSSLAGLPLPDHSRITLSADKQSITFDFPEGVYFVQEDAEGKPSLHTTITYTCNCSASEGGCTVIHAGGDFGCLHGSCQGSCTGTYSDDGGNPQKDALTGSFLDLNKGVSFLRSNEAVGALFAFRPFMLALPEAAEGRTMLSLHQVAALTQGHAGPSRVVGINFYGTLAGISLPESYLATLPHAELLQTVTCACGAGTGCVLREGEGVAICVGGNCSSCAMTVEEGGPGKD